MDTDFQVGDIVTVFSGANMEPTKIVVVKRVMKRFVELEDESKWDLSGQRPYPYSQSYWYPYIAHTTDEHRVKMRRNAVIRKIDKWYANASFKNYSLPDLDRIWAIVSEIENKA